MVIIKTPQNHLNNINKPEHNYANNENNDKDTIKLPWILHYVALTTHRIQKERY